MKSFILAIILTSHSFDSRLGLNLVSPIQNQVVSDAINLFAQADGPGIKSIQFKLDKFDYGPLITSGSCRAILNTLAILDGLHTTQVIGIDVNNNLVSSPEISFIVDNSTSAPPPTQANLTIISPAQNENFPTGLVQLPYNINYTNVFSYSIQLFDAITNNPLTNARNRTTDGTSPDVGNFSLNVGTLSGQPIGDGSYKLVFAFSTVSTSVNFTIGSQVPTPTPIPTPTPTPTPVPGTNLDTILTAVNSTASNLSGELSKFRTSVQADFQILQGNIGNLNSASLNSIQQVIRQELALALIPPVPPTCNLEIRSILSPYADGDYKIQFKVSKNCATPVLNAIWKSLNIK